MAMCVCMCVPQHISSQKVSVCACVIKRSYDRLRLHSVSAREIRDTQFSTAKKHHIPATSQSVLTPGFTTSLQCCGAMYSGALYHIYLHCTMSWFLWLHSSLFFILYHLLFPFFSNEALSPGLPYYCVFSAGTSSNTHTRKHRDIKRGKGWGVCVLMPGSCLNLKWK